jgi:hypothetical protein
MRALEVANVKRSAAARLKQEIAGLPTMEGRGVAADVLEHGLDEYGFIKVHQLLEAIQVWGVEKVQRRCRKADCNPMARIDELSDTRRNALISLLRDDRRGA